MFQKIIYSQIKYILEPTNKSDINQIANDDDDNFKLAEVASNFAVVAATILLGSLTISVASLAVKAISKSISNQKEENSDIEEENKELIPSHNKMAQLLDKIDLSDWEDFVEQISFKSISRELDFPLTIDK